MKKASTYIQKPMGTFWLFIFTQDRQNFNEKLKNVRKWHLKFLNNKSSWLIRLTFSPVLFLWYPILCWPIRPWVQRLSIFQCPFCWYFCFDVLIFGSRVSEEEKVEFEKPANLISAMRRLCCQNGVSSCHRSNASPSQNGKSSSCHNCGNDFKLKLF